MITLEVHLNNNFDWCERPVLGNVSLSSECYKKKNLENIRPFSSELSVKRVVKISHKLLIPYYEFLILFLTS